MSEAKPIHVVPAPSEGAGPVMIIGGAEDKLRDRVILARFVNLAGGADAHLVVLSTASSLGEEATGLYRELFIQLGAGRVSGLRPITRDEANDPAGGRLMDEATGVFLTGGNQLRLASVVAQSTSLVGLGLDEDTAAVVYADQSLEVIGRGAVTIVDGSEVVTDSYQTKGHRPMMVSGAILHSLPAGYRFDLSTRSLLSGPAELGAKVPRAMETARN